MAWDNDKLGRSTCANFLTTYLTNLYGNSDVKHFVLAVDAEWGEGKTYMLENWKEDLSNSGHPVIYFNSWENDFSNDPLIAIISDLNEQLEHYYTASVEAEKAFSAFIGSASRMLKSSAKILAMAATKKILGLGLEELGEALNPSKNSLAEKNKSALQIDSESVEKTTEKLVEIVFEDHIAKKISIKNFKLTLEHLVKMLSLQPDVKLPLFIMVDELDRCRPDYAIELLEGIKHLFGVHGIYFIIATNMKQLSHSVGILYGSNFES